MEHDERTHAVGQSTEWAREQLTGRSTDGRDRNSERCSADVEVTNRKVLDAP
jgi:hypothetical protein